jgi:predicted nucleic acid-binding protein
VLIYLDANILIYAVEAPAGFGARALARLHALSQTDRIAVSELTRMECCSYPLSRADFPLLRLYDGFFQRPDVIVLPITPNVFRRATLVQAVYNLATVDSIHLATAIENGCDAFLTNDPRLASCQDIAVEILP